MAEREDLEKLFEAALQDKAAPARFGTPEALRKTAPAAFRRSAAGGEAAADDSQAAPAVAVTAAERGVRRDTQAGASLDVSINAELAAIMDEKVDGNKRRRRRSFLVTMLFFLGVAGAVAGWVVSNPDRFEALKMSLAEIKSLGDVKGMAAKYQKALDKVAVRGKQIDAATSSLGVDPTAVDENRDGGFDKEMKELMGEDGGKTTAERDKLLKEKFKSVQESGSLTGAKDGETAGGE